MIAIIIKEEEYKAEILKRENIGFVLIKYEIIDSIKVLMMRPTWAALITELGGCLRSAFGLDEQPCDIHKLSLEFTQDFSQTLACFPSFDPLPCENCYKKQLLKLNCVFAGHAERALWLPFFKSPVQPATALSLLGLTYNPFPVQFAP